MQDAFRQVILFNPVEIFSESPRSMRFMRALSGMPGVRITTIGLGTAVEGTDAHLNLADEPAEEVGHRAVLRSIRLLAFAASATLRFHRLTAHLHSPNRQMRSNWLLRRRIQAFTSTNQPDLVIARDIFSIALLRGIVPRQRLWIDLPDLTAEVDSLPVHFRRLFGPYFGYLTRQLKDSADIFTTVSDSLSRHFARHFGVEPAVVRNALPYHSNAEIGTRSCSQSTESGNGGRFKMVYVGGAVPHRGIEICIDTVRSLPPEYSLDLYLVPMEPSYFRELRRYASAQPRVRIMPAVPLSSLISTMAAYNAALVVVPLTSVNSSFSLPNKFFQGVQARLPIVTGPTPELASLVRAHGIGEVSTSFAPEDIATACLRLTPSRVSEIRLRMDDAARTLAEDHDVRFVRERVASTLRRI